MKVHMSNRHNDASEEDSDLDTMSESDGSSAEDEEEDGRREDGSIPPPSEKMKKRLAQLAAPRKAFKRRQHAKHAKQRAEALAIQEELSSIEVKNGAYQVGAWRIHCPATTADRIQEFPITPTTTTVPVSYHFLLGHEHNPHEMSYFMYHHCLPFQVYVHCIQAHSLVSNSGSGVPDSVVSVSGTSDS